METGGLPFTVNLMFFMCTFMDMSTPQVGASGFLPPCFFVWGEFGEFGSDGRCCFPPVSVCFADFLRSFLGWIRVKTTHNASIGSYRTIIEFLAPIAIDRGDHGYVVVRSYHNKP